MAGNPEINGDSLARWEWAQRARGTAPSSIRLYRHYLARLAATLDGRPVDLEAIDAFLASPHWTPNTRRSAAVAVRSWLTYAHRAGIPAPTPLDVELPRTRRGLPRPAADEDIRAALRRCDADTGLMILLAAEAGLRRAEIARLEVADLAGGVLRIRGKGGRERAVPCPTDLAPIIAHRPGRYVFPGRLPGRPITADAVGRRMSRSLPDGVTAHTLRHRFATTVYRAGRDILALSQLLGHASVATTQIYAAAADDAMRRAVDDAAVIR